MIGAGFTQRTDKKCNLDAIDALIDAIPDETLRDEAFLTRIDPSERLYEQNPEDESFPNDVRDALKNGAREYDVAVSGHRYTQTFAVPGTPLQFVFAGGDSWGDDPFDGWSDLVLFTDFADSDPAIAEAAGYVCGGLPSATIVAQYAKGN